MNDKIGILGGMGPLATAIFLKKVIDLTDASCDQENIPFVILNDTDIPDRTAYILGKSTSNPVDYLLKDLEDLEKLKCTHAAMICNTAHFFYDELQNKTPIKILNMVELTLEECSKRGFKKVGLMATEGTVKAKVYEKFNKFDIELVYPDSESQKMISEIIYDYVKKNKKVPRKLFGNALQCFLDRKCQGVIMGCTELSVVIDDLNIASKKVVDSTETIAKACIDIIKKN